MSFFEDIGLGAATPGTLTSIFDPGDLLGTDAAARARDASQGAQSELERAIQLAIDEQRRAGGEAQEFLSPFGGVGLEGVEQAGFLTDPQAQFDFLQNNPLFQLGLQNLNQQTQGSAAASGRLSAGDTLAQLQNNALLAGVPLIDRQSRGITDLLNFGGGIAQSQANTALGIGTNVSDLFQSRGNVGAQGIVGRNQIIADTTAGQQQLAGTIFSAFSDPRLKSNCKIIGKENGFNIWSWTWNKLAKDLFNLIGDCFGVMLPEVLEKKPEAVSYQDGFGKVNYSLIGVNHG